MLNEYKIEIEITAKENWWEGGPTFLFGWGGWIKINFGWGQFLFFFFIGWGPKKYRKTEYVQLRVCFINVQSYLHENVLLSVCALIYIMTDNFVFQAVLELRMKNNQHFYRVQNQVIW